ncbi:LysM peptidoglycan-binding domain-containing protein [Latilactobacillus sakei]|uniref:aggregation-promoting factor n=1 Tax=Latilactobacillus sakei TaxID=1599 RepID=UPI000B60B6FE|nr:LysM domain-containing protein [Latilactobacillus sakei]ASN12750.1 peptidase M23 [Latilactobacillus sakei]MCM1597268.1 LysM peptidoglycan-binding domain-containing protein [Latilactobacillus sakei]MCM1635133.1 LysM peptidoglycan-binding domain-containing protein [Latilactobacillus sakei]USF98415.1 peptidase M23 [Latilactobacillus sakei]USG04043.1 peptidase M23 [Latilactobacillus sakei]
MKSLKTLLFSATLSTAATAGLLFASNGHADAATNYTVVSGDTLSSISQKFAGNSSLIEKIANANKIANKNLIYVGETLTIDEETQTVTVAPATTPVATQQTTQAPVATQQPVQKAATQTQPVQTTPVVKQQQTTTTTTTTNTTTSTTNSAKEWIANKESGGSYTASNGQFVGRYQLSSSYLNGDYSASNQERVADQYVTSRYGSWEGAKSFWMANGWY